jgi:hypothetical protein
MHHTFAMAAASALPKSRVSVPVLVDVMLVELAP